MAYRVRTTRGEKASALAAIDQMTKILKDAVIENRAISYETNFEDIHPYQGELFEVKYRDNPKSYTMTMTINVGK